MFVVYRFDPPLSDFYNESSRHCDANESDRDALKMKRTYLLLLCVGVLSGCPVPQANVARQDYLIEDPVTRRAYRLYVSSKYDRMKPAPMIISLHGTRPWDTAARQLKEWKKIAEDQGAILVCPELRGSDGIFPAGDANMTELLLRDERFVLTVIGQLHYKYNIDRRNIFLTSWSGGGYPLWFIALRHPDMFAAACARQSMFRASAVDGWYPDAAKRMPILIFYGTLDLPPVVSQSKLAHEYLQANGFQNARIITTKGGHSRHPDVAMQFFLRHWRTGPDSPARESIHLSRSSRAEGF